MLLYVFFSIDATIRYRMNQRSDAAIFFTFFTLRVAAIFHSFYTNGLGFLEFIGTVYILVAYAAIGTHPTRPPEYQSRRT